MSALHLSRIYPLPSDSFFLFGLRGVGKSTWARRQLPKARRFDLLDEGLFHHLLADPAAFGDELRELPIGSWVVVDEVQRLPQLVNEVHRAIEERRLRFALLGSSARKLMQAGTNLLAGRAVWKRMYPFTPSELGEQFDLERTLRYGAIPLVWFSARPAETLTSYAQLYLREEIKAEALVRNLPAFARFLPVAALFHGQALNISALARDAGAARATVAGYLDILEDTLVAERLPGFEGKLRVRERRLPKLYWTDPGMVRAIKKNLGPVSSEERGALFEGWIFTLLRTYREVSDLYDEIFYWSPTQARKTEVDFLLRKGSEFVAIEVKSSARHASAELRGLRAIAELEGVSRRVLLIPGRPGEGRRRTAEDIEIWPLDHFLEVLETGSLWQ
ncbi:MAG: DUF4143 domain-containing protein [Thermoanaerobaculia bacterium]